MHHIGRLSPDLKRWITRHPIGREYPMNIHLLVLIDIDICLCPFSSRYATSEQDVDFSVGSVSHLGNLEVGDHEANE